MNIRPMGAELFSADGQTAMMNTAYLFTKGKMCLECVRT